MLQCLEKNPEARPASAAELVAALMEGDAVESWRAPQARAWWQDHAAAIARHDMNRTISSATGKTVMVAAR